MKKKILICTTALILIIGFLAYKFTNNIVVILKDKEVINIKNKKINFFIENEKIFINCKINNVQKKLLFDTGATQNIIFDSLLFIKDVGKNKRVFEANKISTPDGKDLYSNIGLVKFESEILNGNPLACFNIKKTKFICTSFDGFFSLSSFLDEEKVIKIDFQSNTIEVIDKINKTNYAEVPFELSLSGKLLIKIKIQNIDTWATFDTGFDGFIVGSKNYKNKIHKTYKTEQNQSFATQTKPIKKDIRIYNDIEVVISNQKYLVDVVNNKNFKSDQENIGYNFIKNFDWIFDFKNNKAYFKPISKSFRFNKEPITYNCIVESNKLIIGLREGTKTEFQLNDQILSVNSIMINKENICEYKQLLNNENDWSKFVIKIKQK